MTSLATIQDLEDIWRPLTGSDDSARIQRLLDKASSLLLVKAPYVTAKLAAQTIDPLVVAAVVSQVVKRYLVNPDGTSTAAQTVGPYSESKSFVDRYEGTDGSASIRGGLQVTKTDLDSLIASTTAQIGTIRLAAGMAPVRDRNGVVALPAELLDSDTDWAPLAGTGPEANFNEPGTGTL